MRTKHPSIPAVEQIVRQVGEALPIQQHLLGPEADEREREGEEGVLDEDFTYSDGSTEKRVWRLKHLGNGRYSGTAGDVVGTALGETRGNTFRWGYTLSLPVDGKVYEVQFDDWMYLMDERVMLNKAVMSKFGIRLGEVTLSFTKA